MPFRRNPRFALALLLAALPLAGCDGSPTAAGRSTLTVSGTVVNRSGQPIPDGARVMVGWTVSATSPDYTYIFGEGTLSGDRFTLTLDQPPPAEALNAGALGVGVIFVTTSPDLHAGMHLEDAAQPGIIGAAGQQMVIYKAPGAQPLGDWARSFPDGYSVGAGVKRTGTFDAFRPVSPSGVQLIIDDLANIEFVDWT